MKDFMETAWIFTASALLVIAGFIGGVLIFIVQAVAYLLYILSMLIAAIIDAITGR